MDSAERQQVTKTDQMDHQEDSAASAQAVLSPEASIHPILQLQQTIGNMAVQRLARLGAFQPSPDTAGAAAPASSRQTYGPGAAGQALMMAAVKHTASNGHLAGLASATPVSPPPMVAPLPTPAMPAGAAMERLEPHPEAPAAPATPVAPMTETIKPAPGAAGLMLGMTAPMPAVTETALQPPEMSMAMATPEAVLAPPAPPRTAAPAVPTPTSPESVAQAPRATIELAPVPVAPTPRPEVMTRTAPAAPAPVTVPVVVVPPETAAQAQPLAPAEAAPAAAAAAASSGASAAAAAPSSAAPA
jgi:hypothetical protein